MPDESPRDVASVLNSRTAGFAEAMGLRFVTATADEVVAELTIGPQHLQVHGIVHGGVHAGVVETVCSVGAAVAAMQDGRTAIGLDNQTSFVRAVRSGTLRATARPIARGRRTQLWQAEVRDEQEQLVAVGRVRLLCMQAGTELAGERLRWPVED